MLLQAPLLLGCDVRNLSNETLQIISNEEVIAVNQDPVGVQAKKVRMEGEREFHRYGLVLFRGDRIVVLLENRKPWSSKMTAHWGDIGFNSTNTVVEARDIWEHTTLATKFQGKLTTNVEAHACKMFVRTPLTN
ncbi:hypothetical protein Patl1_28032 [Pistacia atlantica]|uniref:Uncharacterized protein n=1 Tax=Pistacia atlantica TaxID=434234 RepID=A0ACC1BC82_9ROSI|nr:hypothetical protein Patl1_28032 [Pistacia atlantica]